MLLTDMEMPDKCIDCPFYLGCSYFKKYCGEEECNPMKERLRHCPFTQELPKYHGELKDTDKIYNALESLPAFKYGKGREKEHQTILDCMTAIDLQPDVIKAYREKDTIENNQYYRYEIYDNNGYYKGGIFRGMAYFLNLLFDRRGESSSIQTDYELTNSLSNALIDMLNYPKDLKEGSDLTFYYTPQGYQKASGYIVALKGIMHKYGYKLKEKVVELSDNIVYQDDFQIAVEH